MKRIVFLLKNLPLKEVMDDYREYAAEYGIDVLYMETGVSFANNFKPDYEDIVCTDCEKEYERITLLGENAVVSLSSLDDSHKFTGAQYLLLDCLDTEIEYYMKVWQRFRHIPWQIKETDRLIIRETLVEDVNRFVDLYKDPAMYRYTEPLYDDIEEERKYAGEYIEKVYKVQGFGIWTVILKESNEIIGRVGLVSREGFDGVEIGYSIGLAYQRQGYATEAVKACLEFAKENELSPVRVLTMSENAASCGLLKKLGFVKAGSLELNYVTYDEYLWPGSLLKESELL